MSIAQGFTSGTHHRVCGAFLGGASVAIVVCLRMLPERMILLRTEDGSMRPLQIMECSLYLAWINQKETEYTKFKNGMGNYLGYYTSVALEQKMNFCNPRITLDYIVRQ